MMKQVIHTETRNAALRGGSWANNGRTAVLPTVIATSATIVTGTLACGFPSFCWEQ